MNNRIKDALKIVSEIFPLSFAYSDAQYERLHFATSVMSGALSESESNYNWETPIIEDTPRMEIETVHKNSERDSEVLKLSSRLNGQYPKLSLFIDLTKLDIDIPEPEPKSGELLSNSAYISAYLNLSQREKQITRCMAKMQTSEEIATHLFISTHTVKNHRKNIRKKINFTDREDYSRFLNWVRGYVS